jgi:hypothetical protein
MLAFELLVEAKVAQAEREGAFADLPGTGKPLVLEDDRLVPEDVRAAYRILKNAGCIPAELDERRELASLRNLVLSEIDDQRKRVVLAKMALLEARQDLRAQAARKKTPAY